MRLLSGLMLTCAGYAFLHSGEEFGRSKLGNGNSYNGPADVNMLDWSLVRTHRDLVAWYRGLIGLRREFMPELSADSVKDTIFIEPPAEGVILYNKTVSKGSRFGRYLVCANPTENDVSLLLPRGIWTVLCDGSTSSFWKDADLQANDPYTVPAGCFVILGK